MKSVKKYKTAASIRQGMVERRDIEIQKRDKYQAHMMVITSRIELMTEMIETTDATGTEEEDGDNEDH